MHNFKFLFFVSLAIFLLIIPEPITSLLGIALLCWATVHFGGWLGPINGACRCDSCRNGISKPSHSLTTHSCGEVSAWPSLLTDAANRQGRIRLAQATLPLTRGRDLTHPLAVTEHYLKGGVRNVNRASCFGGH